MKSYFYKIIFLLICITSASFGQTNISGVINIYTAVSARTNSGCTTCNTPACYTDVTVASSAGFAAGNTALIIQMQGAVIDQSGSASFGNITNNNNTGNFEFVSVMSVPNGTTVRLSPLTGTYSFSSSATPGVTQLIKVPVYAGNVNVSATLTAQAWNGTTGGVLAFIASGKVIMNANIDVSGKGFRGNVQYFPSNGNCSETAGWFVPNSTPAVGALKGEGVAMVISNMERGRGKQANGGGGGVGHNGGGGGGGNGGTGGYGGQMYTGCMSLNGRGEGGLALTGSSSRVFMGGAGGTGDNNATGAADPGSDATNGGGIVLIMADSIVNTVNTAGYTGTTGTIYPSAAQYYSNAYTDEMIDFDVLCQLTLNSIVVNAQTAQNVVVSVRSQDRANLLYGPVTVAVPAGTSTVPLGFNILPGSHYMLAFRGTTGSLMFGGYAAGTYPTTIPDVIRLNKSEPNAPGNNIAYAFNWNVTSRCASGGYKIDASGIDNPGVTDADGGGGGGAGGTIFIKANGYRGIINMKATGGEGADMINGGCHAPGAGGGGGYICMNTVPPLGVYRNVAGAAPGVIPYNQATCLSPATGYNSHAATEGTDGIICTGLLATVTCPLPVDFVYFNGLKEGGNNVLTWSTATEQNNNYFIVERSSNGNDFGEIGRVKGQGNSNSVMTYQYRDENPVNGINYYRLKQVDIDNSFSYSKVIAIVNKTIDFEMFPNPSNGAFVIRFMASGYSYKLDIADVKGINVYSCEGDEVPESLEVKGLANGIYIARFYYGNEVITKKLLVY
jgi:hypothetical protein